MKPVRYGSFWRGVTSGADYSVMSNCPAEGDTEGSEEELPIVTNADVRLTEGSEDELCSFTAKKGRKPRGGCRSKKDDAFAAAFSFVDSMD